jgi:hypothetical protein
MSICSCNKKAGELKENAQLDSKSIPSPSPSSTLSPSTSLAVSNFSLLSFIRNPFSFTSQFEDWNKELSIYFGNPIKQTEKSDYFQGGTATFVSNTYDGADVYLIHDCVYDIEINSNTYKLVGDIRVGDNLSDVIRYLLSLPTGLSGEQEIEVSASVKSENKLYCENLSDINKILELKDKAEYFTFTSDICNNISFFFIDDIITKIVWSYSPW